MKITAIDCQHHVIPLPVVLSDSTHGRIECFALNTVRLRTEDELEGLGYAYTVGNIGGSALHRLLVDELAPMLIGQDSSRIARIWERMWWHLHFVGRGGLCAFAMAAVDVALWDLNAKRQSMPLWRLLGGHSDSVPVYAGGIDLDFSIDQLLAQAQGFLDSGFRAIKTKVGRARLSEDVDRIRAMREFLGDDFPLLVDANMRWSVHEAISAARALARFDVYWLEEPTIPDDIEGHRRIQTQGGLPVATGENLHSVYEFEHMMNAGAVSFPEPDVVTVGGITPFMKVAAMAEARNLPVTSHGVHDLSVHLLAAAPNASYLEVHGFGLEAYMQAPLQIRDGIAQAPSAPGHGVVFDWDRLAELGPADG
ncbi:MAG: mandelate racemase/muconate lactonizing enzyme family protein [Gammaproteobacteria bacterium]|nr:mandelate racemase/muconate lactonizing enzyme family protein [Gammaproteobacteria bacterium]